MANFYAPGSVSGSAFLIRKRIQDKQINADPELVSLFSEPDLMPRKKEWTNLEADGAAVVELAGGAVVLAHAAHQLVRVVLHTGSAYSQRIYLS